MRSCFAAVLGGFTAGFGFALAAVPLASLAPPPQRVVPAVLVMQVAIGLHDCWAERHRADWRVVKRLTGGSVFRCAAGPAGADRIAAARWCGCCWAGWWHWRSRCLWRPRRTDRRDDGRMALVAGFCSGVCNGLAAMSAPPAIIYFLTYESRPKVMRASLMAFFPLASLLTLPMLAVSGLLTREPLVLAALGAPIMVGGGQGLLFDSMAIGPIARRQPCRCWQPRWPRPARRWRTC